MSFYMIQQFRNDMPSWLKARNLEMALESCARSTDLRARAVIRLEIIRLRRSHKLSLSLAKGLKR